MAAILNLTQDWEHYPCNLPHSFCVAEGKSQRQVLQNDASRLFSGRDDVEVWKYDYLNDDSIRKEKLDRLAFERVADDKVPDSCIYFIHQRSSWGYLQVSAETFQKLLTAHSVTPAVLDAVHSFGAKVTGEDDPLFNICHCSLYTTKDESQVISRGRVSEFCYIVRYFEKHGRTELKQAWSLRQTFFYQKYDLETQKAVWIVLQPMQKYKTELETHESQILHPMAMHSVSLNLGLSNWRWYLDDIRKTILQFTEKASYSSLGFHENDYDTKFTDAQRLRTLCDRLTIAISILDANMDLAHAIRKQCRDLSRLKLPNLPGDNDVLTRVNLDIQRLKGFKRTSVALRLIHLLSYRRADILNDHAEALRGLTITSTAQSASLRDLTEKTRMDSRCMRILTFIALMYLPANLIASIFSGDLVQIPRAMTAVGSSGLAVQPALWVYVLASIALTGLTLAGVVVWDRRNGWLRIFGWR